MSNPNDSRRTGRKPTGQLVVNHSKITGAVTSYGVRVRVGGKRRYITLSATTEKAAKTELSHVIADIQRGIYEWPEDLEPETAPVEMPTFAQFATDWFHGKVADGLGEKTQADLLWRLSHLKMFGPKKLDAITAQSVDAYKHAKVKEGTLSHLSINRTIDTLQAILERAVEYDHIAKNPARGKGRRLKTEKPRRTHISTAMGISALLDAAGELDAQDLRRTVAWRRPLIAVLVFAGLRIDEALSLEWQDVNLADGRLRVRGTKTAAADRTVRLLPVLRDELLAYSAAVKDRTSGTLVFGTTRAGGRYQGGAKHSPSNIRNRVLRPAVELANTALSEEERLPHLTPHSLRRTLISVLLAIGEPLPDVMAAAGHTTSTMTVSVYAKVMQGSENERDRLRRLVNGEPLVERIGQSSGQNALPTSVELPEELAA